MNRVMASTRTFNFFPALYLGLSVTAVLATTPVDAENSDILARGAKSWSENCARCHEMRDPMEFRDDLWRPIVTHMRVRAGLTGLQQREILAFLQSANNRMPEPRGNVTDSGVPTRSTAATDLSGAEIYQQTCVACHGQDGTGAVPGAPDLTAADGPLAQDDGILLRHITEGFKTPGSPMAMPPKGGNPALGGADIQRVLGYLREKFGAASQ